MKLIDTLKGFLAEYPNASVSYEGCTMPLSREVMLAKGHSDYRVKAVVEERNESYAVIYVPSWGRDGEEDRLYVS